MKREGYWKTYQPGEIIFREGEEGDCAYIIEHGRVQVSVKNSSGSLAVSFLPAGEIFGEMALIDGLPRSATVQAVEVCKLCVVSKQQLFERINDADPVVRLLMSVLLKRIRQANHKMAGDPSNSGDFDPNNTSFEDAVGIERIRFEAELQEAYDQRQFYLQYQPIISMKTGQLKGFESLCRWKSPTRGLVSPAVFINVLENCPLMMDVGRWIHDQAMQDLATLHQHTDTSIFMSINISGRQFLDPHFLQNLDRTRKKLKLNPAQIKLEVTERIFMKGASVSNVLEQCHQQGYVLSLDDFGTGYSSLSYLGQFAVDNLKIDRSFVMNIRKDAKSKAIVQAIISMAQALRLDVIAEGVETQAEMDELISMGCDQAQGYYFAKPMDLADAIKFAVSSSEKDSRVKKIKKVA